MSSALEQAQDARETRTLDADRPRLLHIVGLDGVHGLCGTRLRNSNAVIWDAWPGPSSCIVCDDLWLGLPYETQSAICDSARGRS